MRLRSSLSEPLGVLGRGTSWAEPRIMHPEGTMQTGGLHEPSLRMNISNIRPPPVRPISYSGPAVTAPLGPFGTAKRIVQREGFLALYKGLGAVYLGIVPKMAIRFLSFEQYKEALSKSIGSSSSTIFLAGLASGLTEAVLVVTPSEVCKIRMQAQYNSMIDPAQLKHRKYTNVLQTAVTIVREEGIQALYKGLIPTMLRQGCNQAVNFTAYQWIKTLVLNSTGDRELNPLQSLLIGGLSGGMGPLANNPLGKSASYKSLFCALPISF
jgi:solute carrier family 25 (mitochondrial citrate transporter), member 1